MSPDIASVGFMPLKLIIFVFFLFFVENWNEANVGNFAEIRQTSQLLKLNQPE